MDCSTPVFPVLPHLPELAQTHVHWVGDAIQPSHPLSSPSPPAFNLSQYHESVLHIRWPKYWSFSFHISPSNEYSGLISFRIDWFDLLAVQGTLNSLIFQKKVNMSIKLKKRKNAKCFEKQWKICSLKDGNLENYLVVSFITQQFQL